MGPIIADLFIYIQQARVVHVFGFSFLFFLLELNGLSCTSKWVGPRRLSGHDKQVRKDTDHSFEFGPSQDFF